MTVSRSVRDLDGLMRTRGECAGKQEEVSTFAE